MACGGGAAGLLLTTGPTGFAPDPGYAVRIRAERGLLSQQALVWRGAPEQGAPTSVRFVGPRTVEIVDVDGCRYRSGFDARTLQPDPVHRRTLRNRC